MGLTRSPPVGRFGGRRPSKICSILAAVRHERGGQPPKRAHNGGGAGYPLGVGTRPPPNPHRMRPRIKEGISHYLWKRADQSPWNAPITPPATDAASVSSSTCA